MSWWRPWRHFTQKNTATWWVHTQRLPSAYAAASVSSWSTVHSYLLSIFVVNKPINISLLLWPYNPVYAWHSHVIVFNYNLRKRTHDLTLPTDVNAVMKQNFVFRMFFTDIQWLSFFPIVLFLASVFNFFTSIVCFVSHVRLSYFIKVLLLLLPCVLYCIAYTRINNIENENKLMMMVMMMFGINSLQYRRLVLI